MKDSLKIKVIAILGPTASGKSSLAIDIARHFGGAILNCDSRQVYRGMDIGTAKPGTNERALVEHHLFDLIDPDTTFSAGDYKTAAAQTISELKSRKIIPVLVGGTGFYYNAIAEGLPPASSDPQTVQMLQQICDNEGIAALQRMLKEKDPQAFSAIDLNNSRRVIRALEIVMVTGRPFSQNLPIKALPEADFLPIVVTRPREILHSRIEIRVKEMFDLGLKREAQELFARFGEQAPGLNSIGYSEWLEFFAGRQTIREVFDAIVINSRQYAKRQETWFKKRPGGQIFDLENRENREKILKSVEKFLNL